MKDDFKKTLWMAFEALPDIVKDYRRLYGEPPNDIMLGTLFGILFTLLLFDCEEKTIYEILCKKMEKPDVSEEDRDLLAKYKRNLRKTFLKEEEFVN